MKRTLLSFIFLTLISISATAQSDCILENNPEWTYYKYTNEKRNPVYDFIRFYVDGTEVINGKTYHKLYHDEIQHNGQVKDHVYCGSIREEGNMILANYDNFVSNGGHAKYYNLNDDGEVIIYNYDWKVGDIISNGNGPKYTIEKEDTIESMGREWSRLFVMNNSTFATYIIIKGIGKIDDYFGLLLHHMNYYVYVIDGVYRYANLNTFKLNGEIVYKAPKFEGIPEDEPFTAYTFKEFDPFLIAPLMEDGKVWNYGLWTAAALTTPGVNYTPVPQTYMVEGDTVIDGRSCMKLFSQRDNNEKEFVASYYETAGKVYMVKDGETEGRLVYDFSAKKGDVISVYNCEEDRMEDVTIHDVQTMNVQGKDLKCLFVKNQHDGGCWWLEGIGSSEGFEYNIQKNTPGNTIKIGSVYLGDKCLFLAEDDKPSGIEDITTNTTNSRTDNAIYDLMGRRLNGVPAKGIYIQNGKKYVR